MTKQEQIKQMIKIFTDNREVCHHMRCVECKYHSDEERMYSSYAYSLYQAGYENVSEYKAEIEKLKAENEKRLTCDFVKTAQKKAVKKFAEKLKGKLHYFGDGGEKGAYITEKDIDELIKEVEKQ